VAAALAGDAGRARAAEGPGLIVGAPEYDREAAELVVLVGALRSDGSPAKLSDVRLVLDGSDAGAAVALDPVSSYAADHPKWEPPIAVGVVYLWAQGSPQQVLDGVEALFKHLPARTTVYPTPYGQGYRDVMIKITAARAAGGDLAEAAPFAGDQYKLLKAVRFNMRKLSEDDAPIKHLVIVTDGRDYESAQDRAAFAQVGEELRKKRLRVEIASFRASADTGEAAVNLRELAQAAGARALSVDRPADLPPLVESLAESVADMTRARFGLPLGARSFGGVKKVGISASADGTAVTGEDGTVTLPGGSGVAVMVVVLLLVAGGAGVGVWFWRQRAAAGGAGARAGGGTPSEAADAEALEAVLDEVQELIRLGIPAQRAVEELSLSFPDAVHLMVEIDPVALPQGRYRYLRTRAGQARLREIQQLLQTTDEEPTLDEEMAQLLAGALAQRALAHDAARRLRARVSGERWSAFARASEEDLDESLRAASEDFPELGGRDALTFALDVQDALRGHDSSEPPVSVGWLVRAAGPGLRGQTLRLPGGRCRVGRGAACQIRLLEDDSVAEEQAEITQKGGEFVLVPLASGMRVEGRAVDGRHMLVDGETLEIGAGRYVFKSVT